MPRPTSPPNTANVDGRSIVIVRGTKTQTINVCTQENLMGTYEVRYRLAIAESVSVAELQTLGDLDAVGKWALAHGAALEGSGSGPGTRLPSLVDAPPLDDPWVATAIQAVERVLDRVVDGFRERPYLHRVEHSLHVMLYGELKRQPELCADARLATGEATQLVHKEWPETIPGAVGDDHGPRGLFDIAVLTPEQVSKATLAQFLAGRIAAPIAIEVGLDYGLQHLTDDAAKLKHSEVPAPYLLHLSRLRVKDGNAIESLLSTAEPPLRSAYVQLDPVTGTRYKYVNDPRVQAA